MATTTGSRLNLIKPDYVDSADIMVINENMQKLEGTVALIPKVMITTLTIAGWVGAVAPFKQTVVATGHNPSTKLAKCGVTGSDIVKIKEYAKAFVWFLDGDEALNSITFSALVSKPTLDLQVMIVIGDKV